MQVTELNRNGFFNLIVLVTIYLLPAFPAFADSDPAQPPSDAAQPSSEVTSPPAIELFPFNASFSASIDKGVAIDGRATRTLQPLDNGLWRYRFNVDSFIADIDESVVFRWQDNQVQPISYRYKLSGVFIRDRLRAIDFDWKTGVARGHHEDKSFELPLEPGILDPLGYQLQLHQDLRAGKTDVTYTVIDKGRFDVDRFAVIDAQTLDTQLGEVDTVLVEKVRREDSKRETLMWFASDWDHLLVQLTQKEPDGTRYEIHIESRDFR